MDYLQRFKLIRQLRNTSFHSRIISNSNIITKLFKLRLNRKEIIFFTDKRGVFKLDLKLNKIHYLLKEETKIVRQVGDSSILFATFENQLYLYNLNQKISSLLYNLRFLSLSMLMVDKIQYILLHVTQEDQPQTLFYRLDTREYIGKVKLPQFEIDKKTIEAEKYLITCNDKELNITDFKIYDKKIEHRTTTAKYSREITKIKLIKDKQILVCFEDRISILNNFQNKSNEDHIELQSKITHCEIITHNAKHLIIIMDESNTLYVINDQNQCESYGLNITKQIVQFKADTNKLVCISIDLMLRIYEINSLQLLRRVSLRRMFKAHNININKQDNHSIRKDLKVLIIDNSLVVIYQYHILVLNCDDSIKLKHTKGKLKTTNKTRLITKHEKNNETNKGIKEETTEYNDEKKEIVRIDNKIKELQPQTLGLNYNELIDYAVALSNEEYLSKNKKIASHHYNHELSSLSNDELVQYIKLLSLEKSPSNIREPDLSEEEQLQLAMIMSLEKDDS